MDESKKELLLKVLLINSKNALVASKAIKFVEDLKRRRRNCIAQQAALRYKLCALLSALAEPSPRRLVWENPRTKMFWEHDCQVNNEEYFKENFRMSQECFNILCSLLPNLAKTDTNMRNAIPLRKRVAIAVYALGSSAEYRTVGNLFGVGKSTVCGIVMEICKEVWNALRPIYMNDFPLSVERIEENVKAFEKMGFPQCFGAIDGCHIEVQPHVKDSVDYYNYKGWYSTVLLALVDYRYRIMYINVGSPGRCNDSTIFEKSLLKKELTECQFFQDMSRTLSNVSVPICILGDSAFKLFVNLMKPYPFSTEQAPAEKLFNYRLSKCRRVVENCFGHLKARFRRIGKGIDNDVDNTNAIIKACCVLHNFCNEHNDQINQTWLRNLQTLENGRQQPSTSTFFGNMNTSAQQIRKAITSFIADGGVDSGGGGEAFSLGNDAVEFELGSGSAENGGGAHEGDDGSCIDAMVSELLGDFDEVDGIP